jgi:hypothetical protein
MRKPTRVRTWIVTAAAALGASVGVAGLAGAATSGSTATTTPAATATATPAAAATPAATAPDPATVSHGPGETVQTGDVAAKLTAAAKAAVPGATVIRVETDSGGAAYEAHMTKADGSRVTVKFDSNYKVTATQDGFGSGGPGGPQDGTAPAGA